MSTDATQRFTSHAGAYDAGRPTYPSEALTQVFNGLGEPRSLSVADLGAGTGISSKLLAERGARVFAIEPNAAMRTKGGDFPGVAWIDATAEATGLPASSVDLVTAFQAFHWFDAAASFTEMQRILKDGGRAAAVYYERDERDPFTAAYGDIIRRFATDETEQRRADALEAFATWKGWRSVERSTIGNEHGLDLAGMGERIKSTSYVPQSGPENEALYRAVQELFQAHAVDGRVGMALQTIVVIAQL